MVFNSSDDIRKSKSKGGIKDLLRRIITPKTKIENRPNKYTDSHQYEFDALPTENLGNARAESQNRRRPNCKDDAKNHNSPKMPTFNNHRNDGFQDTNEDHFKSYDNSGGFSNVKNQTIYEINNGVGFHIGTSNVVTQNIIVNPKSNVHNRKREKTAKIKALLKCRELVQEGHLEFLSRDLGSKWKDVGKTLGLSEAELETIRKRCKKQEEMDYLKERAYKVLYVWWYEKRRECAAIGELCEILWEGDITTAWDAVHKLSLKIELFK